MKILTDAKNCIQESQSATGIEKHHKATPFAVEFVVISIVTLRPCCQAEDHSIARRNHTERFLRYQICDHWRGGQARHKNKRTLAYNIQ